MSKPSLVSSINVASPPTTLALPTDNLPAANNTLDDDFAFEMAQSFIESSPEHAIELLKEVENGPHFVTAKKQLANLEYQLSQSCSDIEQRSWHLKQSLVYLYESSSQVSIPVLDKDFNDRLKAYVGGFDAKQWILTASPATPIHYQLFCGTLSILDKLNAINQGNLSRSVNKGLVASVKDPQLSSLRCFKSSNKSIGAEFSHQRKRLLEHLSEMGTLKLLSTVSDSPKDIFEMLGQIDNWIEQGHFVSVISALNFVKPFSSINTLRMALGKYLLPLSIPSALQVLLMVTSESDLFIEAQYLIIDIENHMANLTSDKSKKHIQLRNILIVRNNIFTSPTETADRLANKELELSGLISACNAYAGLLPFASSSMKSNLQNYFGFQSDQYYGPDSWATKEIYFNIIMYYAEILRLQLQARTLPSQQTSQPKGTASSTSLSSVTNSGVVFSTTASSLGSSSSSSLSLPATSTEAFEIKEQTKKEKPSGK